jgi:molybdopterin-guanine dinucleotide biosynthesis protein A
MGRDKARLESKGRAWSARIAEMLDSLFEETLLVGGAPGCELPGRRIPDPEGPACALRGLVAALGAAASERVLVVATDLPIVSQDLLLALTAWPETDVVVPVDEHGEHPLCALDRREPCLQRARARLEAGKLALRELLAELETARVPLSQLGFSGVESDLLTNVNTPQELARWEAR